MAKDNIKIMLVPETDSTNKLMASQIAANKPHEGFAIRTDYQARGRGQAGNVWLAEPGKNVLMSLVLYPEFLNATRQFLISKAVSVAIAEVLEKYTGNIKIKWPNDIYANGRKLAGILIENAIMGPNLSHSIIGFGININQCIFDDSLPNPVSLSQLTGQVYNIEVLSAEFAEAILQNYNLLKTEDGTEISNRYEKHLLNRTGFFKYRADGIEFVARLIGVEPSGCMILEDTDGQKTGFWFKEIEYLGPA